MVTAESGVAAFCEKLAHFLVSVVKVGVVTAEASQSEELREWDGIFYDVAFVKIRFWSVVVGEKFVFYEAYEEVGVARSHFGSHCNTVDLFVEIVTKRKTVECENQFS